MWWPRPCRARPTWCGSRLQVTSSIPDGSTVEINGAHALSLVALNNAKIGESITFDVSGTDATSVSFGVGKVGGGDGGTAGTGSAGGLGSAGKNGGIGGNGGGGGAATGDVIYPGADGWNGQSRAISFAESGTHGTPGTAGRCGIQRRHRRDTREREA